MIEVKPIRDTTKADAVYALACELLPALRVVARSKGYALAYHGSFARDIDVIAAPWTDSAVDALELAEAIRAEAARISGHTAFSLNDENAAPRDYQRRGPEPKPHGRLGWSIHIAGAGTYIDLSVLSAGTAHRDVKLAELQRMLDASYEETIKQSKRAQTAEAELSALTAPRPMSDDGVTSIRFRCPKCGLVEQHDSSTPWFDLTFEEASDHGAQHVSERLRVECGRCGYAGYEDCADAPKD